MDFESISLAARTQCLSVMILSIGKRRFRLGTWRSSRTKMRKASHLGVSGGPCLVTHLVSNIVPRVPAGLRGLHHLVRATRGRAPQPPSIQSDGLHGLHHVVMAGKSQACTAATHGLHGPSHCLRGQASAASTRSHTWPPPASINCHNQFRRQLHTSAF